MQCGIDPFFTIRRLTSTKDIFRVFFPLINDTVTFIGYLHRNPAVCFQNCLQGSCQSCRKDLSKQLENIFGLGHARHLDRAVSTFLGMQFLTCKTQCGTRRVVYLAGVPERLTQKFRQFYVTRQKCVEENIANNTVAKCNDPLQFYILGNEGKFGCLTSRYISLCLA